MKFSKSAWILLLGFCLLSCQKEELARFQFPDLYPYPTVGMAEGIRNGQPWITGAYTNKEVISSTYFIVLHTHWADWALGESLIIGGLSRLDSIQYKKMDYDFENIYPSPNLPIAILEFYYEDEFISAFPQIASSSNYFRVTAVDTLTKTIQGDFQILVGNSKYAPFWIKASFDVPYVE